MANSTIKWQVNLTEELAMVMATELNMVAQSKADSDTNRSWGKIVPTVSLTMMRSNYTLRRDHTILVTHTKRVATAVLEATVVLVRTTAVIILAMGTHISIRINTLLSKLTHNHIWLTVLIIYAEQDMGQIWIHIPCSKGVRINQIPILLAVDILVKKTLTNYSNCTRVVESHANRVHNSKIMDYKVVSQNHQTLMLTMLLLEAGLILGGLRLIGREANLLEWKGVVL